MGYDFDDNGIYLNWSPLFDYRSLETLHDSERLPTPSGKQVRYTSDGIDITQELFNYSIDPSTKNLVDLIIKVGNNDSISYDNKIVVNEDSAKKALALINKHTTHKIPASLSDKIYKNATSSRIAQIIVDLKNMMAAYTPINMDDPQEAASNSVLGRQEKRITMDNPLSTFVMQVQNMAGKQVIGIAAVAEKIFFAASYYFNEGARSNNPEWIDNMIFYRKFKLSDIDYQTRSLIANINLNDEQRNYFSSIINMMIEKDMSQGEVATLIQQDLGFTADQSLVISALLSAATDNAKELILSKINAGPNLAGVYLHLIMMGIDFSSIAKFMTSPSVQLIADLTKSNIYDDYSESNSVDTVLKELMQGPSVNKYTTLKAIRSYLKEELNLDDETPINKLLTERFKARKTFSSYTNNYEVNRFIDRFNYLIDKLNTVDYDQIIEFYNIYNLAKETTLFGRMLSVNQGFKTDIAGKLKFVDMLESGIALREKEYSLVENNFVDEVISDKPYLKGKETEIIKILREAKGLGITGGGFNIDKFFANTTYKDVTIRYYNLIKGTWNLYDEISRIPHFKALYDVYKVINTFDTSMSNRYNIIYNLKRELGTNLKASQYTSLSNYIDEFLIIKWLESKNFSFVVKAGESYFNKGNLTKAEKDTTLFLNSDDGRASFKWWMENTVINNIKKGILDGSDKTFGLSRNKFIASIRPGKTDNTFTKYSQTYYYLPINMNNRKSPLDEKIFNTYVNEFSKLYKYTYQNYPLTDLFMLYNLIVNKNKYGEDRLTSIFEGFLKDDTKESIIKDLFKYIGESDYTLSNANFELNIDDVLMKIAPVVSPNNEWISNYKYIRQYNNSTKKYDLKYKAENGYRLMSEPSEDIDTYYKYYTLTSPNYDQKVGKMLLNKEDMTPDTIMESLKLLIERNSIKLNIHCS